MLPSKARTNTGYRGVIRVNYENQGQNGFLVKAARNGKRIHKLIHLHRFDGDEKKAFAVAKKEADAFFKANPKKKTSAIASAPSKRNSSGVVGVRLVAQKYRWRSNPEKETYNYYVEAKWSPEPHVYKSKRFSIKEHGEEEAWRLAIKARMDGIDSAEKKLT
ncbi:MAG: hypothetical protein MK080_09805 [Opitutales bacterium]|nr:hypothetical protein [Opitutales bacterium]NRA27365.1 hypothetical protein [Opitutales bacterium]